MAAALVLGSHAGPHDPLHSTAPFGHLGNSLVAPAARWDAIWYLLIADHGYVTRLATEFYPLYPFTARVLGTPVSSSLVGGIVVSMIGLYAALYFLHRLTTLELGEGQARSTVLLLAFFPTSVFFSAVYTEGLFLALTIGAVYAARRGKWAWAGVGGALATLTRPTGVVLIIPLALLYLYGPREDSPSKSAAAGWHPRHRLHPDLLWLLALPAGLIAYVAYLADRFGDPFVMLGQGAAWQQTFTVPFLTFGRAIGRAATGALQIFHGHGPRNVYEFCFLCLACIGAAGALRRLPVAYGAYAVAGIVFILSFPIGGASISSFSRYMAPLFPVLMWLAAWSSERRVYRWVLALFVFAMAVNSARFATWHFVA